MKHTAVCLVALALVVSLCSGYPNVDQEHHDQQQAKHVLERPLSWTYPEGPTVPVEHVPDFQLRHPIASKTVSVECGERQARMVVQKDFFGTGQLVKRADLTLGRCVAVGEDTQAQVLIFETELQDCGSMSRMTDDALIYTFVIDYNPKMLSDSPIVRTIVRNIETAVIVECHYPRHHNVSSLPLDPKWIPFSAVRVAEEFLYFTLTLRTDDWMYERPRYQYYLGDMVRIEATVRQYHHVPLRVFVETCTATLSPDMNSNPRYTFLDQGCLVDARITGTESRFMQRTAENMLQFQFEAFKFQGADSGMLYITCHLRATSTSHDIDDDHRACSYMINDWRESSGVDSACANCDAIVEQRQTGGWGTGGGGGSQTGGGNSQTGGGSGGGGSGGGGSGGGNQPGVSWPSSGSGGTGSTGTFWSTGSSSGNSGGKPWHTSGGGGGIVGINGGGSGGGSGNQPGGNQPRVSWTSSGSSGSGGTGSPGTSSSAGGGGNSGGTTWHTIGVGDGQTGGGQPPKVSWNPRGSGSSGTSSTSWTSSSTSSNTWSGRTGRSVKEHPVYEWAGVVTLGPFEVAEKLA
ncbi:zona pellucida sperm-binding protein 3-like isoform X2 [Hippocampus comes]|uniref:zona pellucida sperm-binding protein 3-like isoform X2 n=1 Tax=Hippocampus comes TaxID=109280 RepID=UPI00094E5152|nr:PREDICTED: zona pellucida sperm-binding protein 3-like isoform X2 [Hippocampus comes]